MAELVVADRALVQALNHAAQPQPLRLLVLLAATVLAAAPALLLAVLAIWGCAAATRPPWPWSSWPAWAQPPRSC